MIATHLDHAWFKGEEDAPVLTSIGGDADFRDWSICEEDEVMPFGTCEEDKI